MIHFAKAQAYGNDFLYVLQSAVPGADLAQLAREMCERHSGVGADGLIVYAVTAADAASMRLLNADGSRAEVSGNGVRALAALLLRDRPDTEAAIEIATEGGTKHLTRIAVEGDRQTFRAAMGTPTDLSKLLPMEIAGESLQPVVLNIGNPQCVLLGPLPERARFERLGAALERHPIFPDGTNVEFADVEAPDRIRILIWERGVGPTSSSGTGSCGALVAAASFGGAARDAAVIAPGGTQRVEWRPESVYLTGWAELVCEGVWLRQIPRRPEPA